MQDVFEKGQFTATSKWLHWLVALIVIPMVFGSFFLDDIPKLYRSDIIGLHKSLGLTILCLMIIRLINILIVGRPPLNIALWEKILSRVVQYALYASLILMPLFGWAMSTAAGRPPNFFGLVVLPFPGITPDKALSRLLFVAHHYTAFVIIGLLFLHVSGAFKHLLIDRNGVMASMLPSRRQ
jgi:cytochrome b561